MNNYFEEVGDLLPKILIKVNYVIHIEITHAKLYFSIILSLLVKYIMKESLFWGCSRFTVNKTDEANYLNAVYMTQTIQLTGYWKSHIYITYT